MALVDDVLGPFSRCEAIFDVYSTVASVRERQQALVHAEHLRHYFLSVVYTRMGTTMIGEACVGSA